jgi:hypothetical protein
MRRGIARTMELATSPRCAGRGRGTPDLIGGTRVRGRLRDSERRGPSDSVADFTASPRPAERPPHPDPLPGRRGEGDRRMVRTMRQRCGLRRKSAPGAEAPSPRPSPRTRGEGDRPTLGSRIKQRRPIDARQKELSRPFDARRMVRGVFRHPRSFGAARAMRSARLVPLLRQQALQAGAHLHRRQADGVLATRQGPQEGVEGEDAFGPDHDLRMGAARAAVARVVMTFQSLPRKERRLDRLLPTSAHGLRGTTLESTMG